MQHDSMESINTTMGRRAFLSGALALGAAVLTGCSTTPDSPNKPHSIEAIDGDPLCQNLDRLESHRDSSQYPDIFANDDALAVAEGLHVNSGSYFSLNTEAIKAINDDGGFLDKNWLSPTLPPAVTKYSEAIIDAANEFDIPPNLLGILATIESAGNTAAASGADAHGIVQVVPLYHRDRIDSLTGKNFGSDEERSAYLGQNPEQCLRIGASYYAECIDAARKQMPDLREDSLVVYARAAAAYNGGGANAGKPFERLPLESKLYVNHVARLIIDVAIAHKLKSNGLTNDDILLSMQSTDVNARAYAYNNYPRGRDFSRYERSADLCGKPEPGIDPTTGDYLGDDAKQVYEDYLNFLKNCSGTYSAPAAPGLRIWLAGGGDSLFLSVPENANWHL